MNGTLSSSSSEAACLSSVDCRSSDGSSEHKHPALLSAFRESREYDLCVCHSSADDAEAVRLVSFLEAPSRGLRCFLRARDCAPGGAVSTELYEAVRSSHCWVLLITPDFLQDEWCLYQMHQALAEGPMSNRIIPTMLHLPFSQRPKELQFYYSFDLSKNRECGYQMVYRTFFQYLCDELKKNENSVNLSDSVDPSNSKEND
ncbi:toll/interleukin-1 receptor domain-containing adapter protein isoform X2 [Denticeps clupeoides]|uniref:toll/interleukin-1 receptor domain-containing adapter protein isoform X2 n=1 Tax=Denticeps clupeoides TaxID=299321 RepID=UPI0010A4C6B8|nr:toll/interleukin-1 receptor domain-containing adapter protein isoform X2 [Denticeps clupeoides]